VVFGSRCVSTFKYLVATIPSVLVFSYILRLTAAVEIAICTFNKVDHGGRSV
jgi:hypothetical protein